MNEYLLSNLLFCRGGQNDLELKLRWAKNDFREMAALFFFYTEIGSIS